MDLEKDLKNSYVAYLDVLGFKELVSRRNTKLLDIYYETIDKILKEIRRDKKEIDSILVSDSTILISPDTTSDFKTLLTAIQTIQATLAYKNIWLRGAVTFGEVYYNNEMKIVVGKGLVDAYLLEQKAQFPRVIIDVPIINKIGNDRVDFYQKVNPSNQKRTSLPQLVYKSSSRDTISHDAFFVSYAHRIILDALQENNLDIIPKLLREDIYVNQDYYPKYLWLKEYFNSVLTEVEISWPTTTQKQRDTRLLLSKCSTELERV